MEDIEMNTNNQFEEESSSIINKEKKEEDSSTALDNIQKELKQLNQAFSESLFYIKQFSPLIEKGTEINMEKAQDPNFEENRKNFELKLGSFGDEINNHFNKALEMTQNLRKFEEFNMTEKELENKLNDLKKRNNEANDEMNKKLKIIEKINNDLKMENEANIREYLDDNLDM